MNIAILGIESSCDDTSAAVVLNGKVVSNVTATQEVHQEYGGVIPELASRAHQKNIIPVIEKALSDASVKKEEVNAIGFTQGPGLMGSLLVGGSFAKAWAMAKNIPLIGVDHMKAHVLANLIDEPKPNFPFLCLTVSGGHTQLVLVNDYNDMRVIGQTRDDAVGEAFDKAAKMLGLPYPGGPLIDQYSKSGNPNAFDFPIVKLPELDFSFSGVKTSLLYFLREKAEGNKDFLTQSLNDICASFQHTLVKTLIYQLKRAVEKTKVKSICIAGGVSANSYLRSVLLSEAQENEWEVFLPDFQYCTDNAGMIAFTAYHHFLKKDFTSLFAHSDPRLESFSI